MDANYLKILAENTPQPSAVKSSFIQKCISFGSTRKALSFENSDVTLTEDPTSLSIISHAGDVNSTISGIFELDTPTQKSSVFNSSVSIQNSFKNQTRGEFDTTVIIDIDSGLNFADTMFEDFLELFLSYSAEHDAFHLLLNYEELCCKGIETLSKVLLKTTATDSRFQKIISTLNFLQLERNTWRLMRILFQDRIETEGMDEDTIIESMEVISDRQIVDNLYQRNSYIRQSQLIIDWLEKNADEDFKYGSFDKFEYFTDKCMAMENSLMELHTMDFNKNDIAVMEVDPDARFRKGFDRIHEADKENESRLFKYMFASIRAGKLDEAQQLAERFGEAWLAAALEGWRLSHDPNYESGIVEGQELQEKEGNKYRDIWKAAAFLTSQQPDVPQYEQALYGSLCGNLKAILSVSKTWDDALWAYIRTSLDKLIEKEIRDLTHSDRIVEDLPIEYWDKILDIEEIFQELEANDSPHIKSGCSTPHHIIQKYIILGDMGGLIEELYNWQQNQKLDGHILRCMAHIILFLRVIGLSIKEELCIPILETYVEELIKSHKVSLVASYTSTLPKEQQIMWYSKFLEVITDNDERQKCLKYAEDAGLDIAQITKTVVKNIREKDPTPSEFSTDLAVDTNEEDYKKISAIDWLIFNPTQRMEAMKQANALMRMFVIQRKTDAAKLLFTKIPLDSVAIIMKFSKAKSIIELPAEEDNITREYLCFKAYLEANDAFNSWFHHSIHGPKAPAAPSGDHVTFKQKVAYEHEMQIYQKDVDMWQKTVSMLATAASDCLYNVLLFVNGGWMVDQRTDAPVDDKRQQQMSNLRKLCIPHMTRLLQHLLHSQGKYREAIQLADTIGSERYQLYKEFTADDLKQFLKASLDSSVSLLNQNMDSLGYEIK